MILAENLLSSVCRTSCWWCLLAQEGRFGDGESSVEIVSVHELSLECMDGWVRGWMDGQMDGQTGGWVNGREDGWMGG